MIVECPGVVGVEVYVDVVFGLFVSQDYVCVVDGGESFGVVVPCEVVDLYSVDGCFVVESDTDVGVCEGYFCFCCCTLCVRCGESDDVFLRVGRRCELVVGVVSDECAVVLA